MQQPVKPIVGNSLLLLNRSISTKKILPVDKKPSLPLQKVTSQPNFNSKVTIVSRNSTKQPVTSTLSTTKKPQISLEMTQQHLMKPVARVSTATGGGSHTSRNKVVAKTIANPVIVVPRPHLMYNK